MLRKNEGQVPVLFKNYRKDPKHDVMIFNIYHAIGKYQDTGNISFLVEAAGSIIELLEYVKEKQNG